MKDSEQLKEAIDALGGEYELVRELGKGATAIVYLLRDHSLDRDVAMKVIRATVAGDEEALARLQREAKLVAQLTHPNIVKLYGTHRLKDGSFALFMEHVPGRNLKELLREEGAFSVPRTLKVLRDVASALAYAHRRRIVHRDVKPENIYIDEEVGSARLADFGVARPWDQDARLTLPGASLGTPAYMSPEQIDGMEVDGRTDVYSLGLVGYELLLGHHPWEGENVFTIIYRQKNDELPVDALGLGAHPRLQETIEKALKKDPADRPESAVAFLDSLSEEDDSADSAAFGGRRPAEDPHLSESLAPIDWDAVGEETGELVAALEHGADPSRESGKDSAIVGAKPKRRWGRWMVAGAAVLVAGGYGVLQWSPWAGEGVDPGAFVPASPSTSPTTDEPAASEGATTEGPTGLLPAQDSEFIGPVGSQLELGVRALDPAGNPLSGAMVQFEVVEGDGILEVDAGETDGEGLAGATLRLPNRPGTMLVLAQALGPDTLRTLLPITVEVGPPHRLVSISGDGQTAATGATLDELLGARVLDEFGNSVPGAGVRFQVLQGEGRLEPASVTTDDVGRAFTRWTLGGIGGTQLIAAMIPGAVEELLTFRATAVAPAPVRVDPEPEPPPAEVPRPGTPRAGNVEVLPKTFSVGGSQVCHLVNGSAVCRGATDRGQRGDGSLSGLVSLALGVFHACGLDISGGGWCWGANDSGQLGDGTTVDRRPAGPVDTNASFSILTGGRSHTCGLGPGGQGVCWGRNVDGQLGTGSRDDARSPVVVSGNHTFLALVAGWDHTCGLVAGGQAYCWGSNSAGQVGDGTQVDRLAPTRVPGSFQGNLVAGANHTCGMSGGEVLCWGDNAFGQLGDGTTEDRSSPTSVAGLPGPAMVLAAGANHTCAILSDRTAYCWGQNLHGQLGNGTTQNQNTPVAVGGGIEFLSLHAGGAVTCAFSRDGAEYCWGLNSDGQLGDGSQTSRSSPVRVGGSRP